MLEDVVGGWLLRHTSTSFRRELMSILLAPPPPGSLFRRGSRLCSGFVCLSIAPPTDAALRRSRGPQ